MVKILFGLFAVVIIFFFISKLSKEEKHLNRERNYFEDLDTTTNIIKDVNYSSKDAKGMIYIICK